MKYSGLVERIAGEGADAWLIHYMARAAADRGEDVIILSIGDPELETPAPILEHAIERLRAHDIRYTPVAGREPLRRAIAAEHQRRTGQQVEASNTIFLSGAQNALFTASMLIAGTGDEVLALEPLYPSYPATIEASGARLVRVPSPPDGGFRIDLGALERAITPRTRAFFFATPNNPSGVILNTEELKVVGDLAQKHSLWLVADEVYAGLAVGGRVPSLAARLPEQVITVSSLSKSHSLPGWRAGWLVGPKTLIQHAENLAMCNLFGLPGFLQDACVTALGMSEIAEKRIRDLCTTRRDLLVASLAGLPGLRCVAPEAGMFTLIDVRGLNMTGHEFSFGLFKAEGVAVLDGGAFGQALSGFVRMCFATDEATLRDAIGRIRRYVTALNRKTA